MQKTTNTHIPCMRKFYGSSSGFVSIEILLFLGIMFSFVLGLLFLLSSIRNYSVRLKSKDAVRGEALSLLHDIQESMSLLKEDDADSPLSNGIKTLERIYSAYGLSIRDVSSGINLRFMSDAFIKNESINHLIMSDPDNNLVAYGWAHKNMIPEEMKNRIKTSFSIQNDEQLFPLINAFPLTNVHYLSEECIAAFLKYYDIADAEKKAADVYARAQRELITDIRKIIAVRKNHRIVDLLGCKTSFWKITFFYDSCVVEAVFCAVPNREEPRKIDHYKLVERTMRL